MKVFQLRKTQSLPINLDEAWQFFSNPKNLMEMTPPELKMTISSGIPGEMYRGEIITYKLTPVLGIGINWVTEITHVKEKQEFIDEQRFGPYKFWHHLHTFKEIKGGVEVVDLIHYGLSFGPLSSVVNDLVISKKLNRIFKYRKGVLCNKFGDLK